MAEQKIAAPFPAPPPFYHHFTKQNIDRLRKLRKEAGVPQQPPTDQFSSPPPSSPRPDISLFSLPLELRHLVPPAPPADGKYTSFGVAIDQQAAEPTLSASEIEQLYPSSSSVRLNPQPQLLALARSLLTTFLSLTGTLSQDPEAYESAVQDLQTLLYNMHDLINQYRPHQARETLVLLMEERVEKTRAEVKAIEEGKEKVRKLLEEVGELGRGLGAKKEDEEEKIGDNGDRRRGERDDAERERRERQRAAWKALAEMERG